MANHNDAASSHRTDWPMFVTTVLVFLLLSVPIVCSLPLLAVGVLMVLSLLKMLRDDQARVGLPVAPRP